MVCVSTNIASSFFLHRAWHPHSSISRISHMDTIDKIVESSLTCNHTWQNFKGLPLKTQISPLLQIPAGDICACKQLKISTSCVQFKCFCKKQSNFLLGFPSFTSLADSLNASGSCSFSISWQRISDVTDFSKVFRFWMEDAYPQYLNLEGCTGLISMQEATIKKKCGNAKPSKQLPSVSWWFYVCVLEQSKMATSCAWTGDVQNVSSSETWYACMVSNQLWCIG